MASGLAASQAEASAARLPLSYRDGCSSLLIALNASRREHNYVPWKSEHERHSYEKCQYDDMIRRMKALSKQKSEAANE